MQEDKYVQARQIVEKGKELGTQCGSMVEYYIIKGILEQRSAG